MDDEVEIKVSFDEALLNLDTYDIDSCNRRFLIENDPENPACCLYCEMPENISEFYSKVILNNNNGPENDLDLVVLLKNDCHIHPDAFQNFKTILFTDQDILEKSSNVILSESYSKHLRLTIDRFRFQEAYFICGELSLEHAGGSKESVLGVKLHGDDTALSLKGYKDTSNKIQYFGLRNLEIKCQLNDLILDKVYIDKDFCTSNIRSINAQDFLLSSNLSLTNLDQVEASIETLGYDINFDSKIVKINSFLSPRGKFYISAESYVDFKIDNSGEFSGIDLVIDMSKSPNNERNIRFPAKEFKFTNIKLIGASDVEIPLGGDCRELVLEDCIKANLSNIKAGNIFYSAKTKGQLFFSGKVCNLLISGIVQTTFYDINVNNIEAMGICDLNFQDTVKNCDMLKLNLDLDTKNPPEELFTGQTKSRIYISGQKTVNIGTILAKLSTFHLEGKAVIGNILIQPIENISTLFWVNSKQGSNLKVSRLAVLSDYNLIIDKNSGEINIVRNENLLTSSRGDVHASGRLSVKEYVYVSAGGSISFDGNLTVDRGDGGLRSKYGNIFISGKIKVSGNLAIISGGSVDLADSLIDTKQVLSIWSNNTSFISNSNINAAEVLIESLNQSISLENVNLTSAHIAIIANENLNIESSNFTSSNIDLKSGAGTYVGNSEISSQSIYINSVRQFLLVHSNIEIKQKPHVLFARPVSSNSDNIIKGGFRIAEDIDIIGVIGEGKRNFLSNLRWKNVSLTENMQMENGSAYIISNSGFIVGSNISASNNLIIRAGDSIEVIPIALHNAAMEFGGYNMNSIKQVISSINAGLVDIEAEKSAEFIQALINASSSIRIKAKNRATFRDTRMNAAEAYLDSDILDFLISPNHIKNQQERIRTLKEFTNYNPSSTSLAEYLNFSKATIISQRIGNLTIYDNYVSQDLHFTQTSGDITLDKSITKYRNLTIAAEKGKILITSPNLQNIYRGSGGGDHGAQKAHDARTVIGGENVYLLADTITSEAAKFEVSSTLKIVAKDGLHILPVSVHNSLMYHIGEKTTVTEQDVRLVISEIYAGTLEVEADGVVKAVSALIKATGVNIQANELDLDGEREIFEKNIIFQGKKKWYGGRQSSREHIKDEKIIPTIIEGKRLNIETNSNTTFEAAEILVEEEGRISSKGNIEFLAKYNTHLRDYKSKKSYFFNCHEGKMDFFGSKTVKEHFYGESPVPTIYYSEGSFFGYSEGKIHSMGAKIVGNDIYLCGKKGVKLEPTPFKTESFVNLTDKGYGLGYNAKKGEASLQQTFHQTKESIAINNLMHDPTMIIAGNNLVITTGAAKANIELKSVDLSFHDAEITTQGDINIDVAHNIIDQTQKTSHFEIGISTGFREKISAIADRVKKLANKRGDHPLDILDRVLNSYALAKNGQDIYQNGACSFGTFGQASYEETEIHSKTATALDNFINGNKLKMQASNITIEGIKCNLHTLEVEAKNFVAKASSNISENSLEYNNFNIEIPLDQAASVSGGYSASASTMNQEGQTKTYNQNYIKVKGKLTISLTEDAAIRGVSLEADEIDIKAKNLVLESLQDTIKERMSGMSMSISASSSGGSITPGFQVSKTDAAWTNALGQIIAKNILNITLSDTLTIAGGLIANAQVKEDGTYTDKGNLNIQAAAIIASSIHDYDNSQSFGLATALSKSVDNQGNSRISFGDANLQYSFDNSKREINASIGDGSIRADSIIGQLNRSINNHISKAEREHAGIDAPIPAGEILDGISYLLSKIGQGQSIKQRLEKLAESKEDPNISPELKHYLQVPEDIEDADVQNILTKIDKEIKKKNPGLSEKERLDIALIAYNLAVELEARPDVARNLGINIESPIGVSAGAPLAIPLYECLMYASGVLIAAAIAQKTLEDTLKRHDDAFKEDDKIKKKRGEMTHPLITFLLYGEIQMHQNRQ
ncbi:MAG: hemagglutinin repeat-containing protein [Rickettsiaceae bacterium]|nr:hemagglutinin repeat-containing protein [Rickettsiaceae bacterium]